MKLSVFTVVTPDLTPEELAAEARAAGLDGIEWRCKEIPEEAAQEKPSFWRRNLCSIRPDSSLEELLQFRRVTERNGLKTVSINPYLNVEDWAATECAFQAAHTLGASMLRVGVPGYDRSVPYPVLFEKTATYLREVEVLARKYGVKGLVETHHNTIAPSASAAYRLVCHCDPERVGVLFDPGNMVFEGFENLRMGMELLGPYLAHVHLKNAGWTRRGVGENGSADWHADWFPMNEGAIDFGTVIDELKAVGYEGYLGLEDFSGQYDSRELLHVFAKQMRERL